MAVDEGEGWVYMLGGMPGEEDDDDESDGDSFDVPIRDNTTDHRSPTPGAPSPPSPDTTDATEGDTDMPAERAPASRQSATLFDQLLGSGGPAPGATGRSRKRSGAASDFWRFRAVGVGKGEWELVSGSTEAEGGPGRLWDAGMVVAEGRLFVFGGRVGRRGDEGEGGLYGGLYEYNLRTKKWRLHL